MVGLISSTCGRVARSASVKVAIALAVGVAGFAIRPAPTEAANIKKTICETIIVFYTVQVCEMVKIEGIAKKVYKCWKERKPREKKVCRTVEVPAPTPSKPKPGQPIIPPKE